MVADFRHARAGMAAFPDLRAAGARAGRGRSLPRAGRRPGAAACGRAAPMGQGSAVFHANLGEVLAAADMSDRIDPGGENVAKARRTAIKARSGARGRSRRRMA